MITPQSEDFTYYSLPPLLPDGAVLALNPTLGTLSCLLFHNGEPRLVAEQQFTDSELSLLRPLLDAYPHFCPYEVLHASFASWHATEQDITASRERLHSAQDTGAWQREMRPVRNVLSRTRGKLHAFDITIASILETGCVLMPVRRAPTSQK